MYRPPQTPSWFALVPALVGLLSLTPSAAHAGELEDKLFEQAKPLLEQWDKAGGGKLAVLKAEVFQLDKEGGQELPLSGLLAANFARRLENALAIWYAARPPEKTTLLVDASRTAATLPGANHHEAAGIRTLFAGRYKELIGTDTARADRFLLGKLVFSPDLKKAAVTLQKLDRADSRPVALRTFEINTDLDLLLESGVRFRLKAGMSSDRKLEEVAADVDAAEPPLKVEVSYVPVWEYRAVQQRHKDAIFQLSNFRRAEAVKIEDVNGRLRMAEPSEGYYVYLNVRRTDPQDTRKYAFVLMLNGESLLNRQTGLPHHGRKWVLGSQVSSMLLTGYCTIKEFSASPDSPARREVSWEPIGVLSEERSTAEEKRYGRHVGQLSLHVFVEGAKPKLTPDHQQEQQKKDRRRALDEVRVAEKPVKNIEELKARFIPAVSLNGLMAPAQEKFDRGVEVVTFNNPVLIGSTTVTYYTPRR